MATNRNMRRNSPSGGGGRDERNCPWSGITEGWEGGTNCLPGQCQPAGINICRSFCSNSHDDSCTSPGSFCSTHDWDIQCYCECDPTCGGNPDCMPSNCCSFPNYCQEMTQEFGVPFVCDSNSCHCILDDPGPVTCCDDPSICGPGQTCSSNCQCRLSKAQQPVQPKRRGGKFQRGGRAKPKPANRNRGRRMAHGGSTHKNHCPAGHTRAADGSCIPG